LTVPGRRPLRLAYAGVDSLFLAYAITYYRWRPQSRAAIGTPDEHRRLYAELMTAYAVSAGDRRDGAAVR